MLAEQISHVRYFSYRNVFVIFNVIEFRGIAERFTPLTARHRCLKRKKLIRRVLPEIEKTWNVTQLSDVCYVREEKKRKQEGEVMKDWFLSPFFKHSR